MLKAIAVAALVAIGAERALAGDYTNATEAAWCAGALTQEVEDWRAGAAKAAPALRQAIERDVIRPFDRARVRHAAFALGYTGPAPSTTLAFVTMGRNAATECQQQANRCPAGPAFTTCLRREAACKRIVTCLE